MFSLGSKYHALDTKLCALRATLIKDFENIKGDLLLKYRESPTSITQEFHKLSKYIYDKPIRDFVKELVYGYANSDIAHYLSLWKGLQRLDKPTQTSMRKIIGTEADMLNIIFIYRLKRYYHVRGDTAYGYLLPIGYRLTTDEIDRLLSAKKEAFLSEVLNGSYGDIFKNMDFPERVMSQFMLLLYKKESRNSSIVALCSYLYEKHLEIRNIKAIYEGLRYKLPHNEILSSLLYS